MSHSSDVPDLESDKSLEDFRHSFAEFVARSSPSVVDAISHSVERVATESEKSDAFDSDHRSISDDRIKHGYRYDTGRRIAHKIHATTVAQDPFPDIRRTPQREPVDDDTAIELMLTTPVFDLMFPQEFSGPKLRDINAFGSVMGYNSSVVAGVRPDRLAVHGFPSTSLIGVGQISDFNARAKTAFMYGAYTGELFDENPAWTTIDAERSEYIPVRESQVTLRDSDAAWFVAHVAMFIDQDDASSYASYASHITDNVLTLRTDKTLQDNANSSEAFTKAVVEHSEQTLEALQAAWKLADKTIQELPGEADDILEFTGAVKKQLDSYGLYANTVFWAPDSDVAAKINKELVSVRAEDDDEDSEEDTTVLISSDENGEIPPIEFKKTSRGVLYVKRPNGQRYYARKMPVSSDKSPATDVEFIRRMYELRMPTLLYGDPGTGKTALVEVALPNLVTLNGTGDTETADFIGSWTPSGPDEYTWINGPLITAMTNGWPLLIDEVALIDPRVMSIVYGVMDGRGEIHVTANPAIGTVQVQPGFYVIGACNPHVPGAVMSDALLSRFSVQLEVTTDYSKLTQLGIKRDTALAAKNLHKKYSSNEIMRAPQLRELFDFEKLRKQLGVEIAVANMISSADENDREVYESVLSSVFSIKSSRMTI